MVAEREADLAAAMAVVDLGETSAELREPVDGLGMAAVQAEGPFSGLDLAAAHVRLLVEEVAVRHLGEVAQ